MLERITPKEGKERQRDLGNGEYAGFNWEPPVTGNFKCNRWDEETKLCTRYDERPSMCRNYPPPGKECDWGCGLIGS